MSKEEAQQKIDAGEAYVIRYKNDHDHEQYRFQDEVHGDTTLSGDMVGDFVLIRSNGQLSIGTNQHKVTNHIPR